MHRKSPWQCRQSLSICQDQSAQFMLVSHHSKNPVTFPLGLAALTELGLTSSETQYKHFITRKPKNEILSKWLLCQQVALPPLWTSHVFRPILQKHLLILKQPSRVPAKGLSLAPRVKREALKTVIQVAKETILWVRFKNTLNVQNNRQSFPRQSWEQKLLSQISRGISCPPHFPVDIQGTDTLGVQATQGSSS